MSTLSSLISGGGGGALPQIALTQSQTWVPPQDGNVCIHVIGAGGGGYGNSNALQGGGAGGYCKKTSLAVTTSGSFTVVVGAGGAGAANAAGTTGGNSTVAGTGLSATLTANGGNGGLVGNADGGSASNGDVNNTGGAGGDGGGAVGIYGTGASGAGANFAGMTDAMGDGMSQSGYGFIVGGPKLNNMREIFYGVSGNGTPGTGVAGAGGALCGGGAVNYVQSGYGNNRIFGGNGGVGGGGGGARGAGQANGYHIGGSGGDGIVLIQYLPAQENNMSNLWIIKDADGNITNPCIKGEESWVKANFDYVEAYVAPTIPEPTAEESERTWRDGELSATDYIVPLSDHPQRDAYITYREALRQWPSTDAFPATRPELGE